MYTTEFEPGDRVIFGSVHADLDGLRATVEAAHAGGYYDLKFDDGHKREGVWESKLLREADHPNYPLPERRNL